MVSNNLARHEEMNIVDFKLLFPDILYAFYGGNGIMKSHRHEAMYSTSGIESAPYDSNLEA